jgi:hypothetical protein
VPFHATYCGGWGKRFRTAARRGEACRGVGDSGKAVTFRKLPTGANRKVIAATIAAAHCAAMWCVSRRGEIAVAVGANLRFKAMPRYRNNLRRGRRPRRPLFGLPPHFASYHCTLLCGCVGCVRLPPRFARRDTQLLAAPHSAGRGAGGLRQILVATRRHLLPAHRAKARHSAILSGFGRADTYTCSTATRLSPKAASLVPFLPRQERNRPPRRRKAVRRGAASPYLQTPQPRRTAVRTHIKQTQPKCLPQSQKQRGEAQLRQRPENTT